MFLANLGKNLMKKFVKKEYNFFIFEHTNYIYKRKEELVWKEIKKLIVQ